MITHGKITAQFRLLIVCLLLYSMPGLTSAEPLMQDSISVAQARRMVDAIIATCSPPGGLLTVTIAVVDRAGQPVMQVRADTAAPHNWELAYRKAYTALTIRRTSTLWRDRTAGDAGQAGQRMLSDVLALGGGIPVMKGDVQIGGLAVSGAKGGEAGTADQACAEAGIAAIADDLEYAVSVSCIIRYRCTDVLRHPQVIPVKAETSFA